MPDAFLKSFSDPNYWRELIDTDARAECREDWLGFNKRAKELLRGRSGQEKYWAAAYPRVRRAFSGRMFYGPIIPKVKGVQIGDDAVAQHYQGITYWEFSRPRGLNRVIGREQLNLALFDWLDYGLGCIHPHFDFRVRDRENFTGSIITEYVDSETIILDSSVNRLSEIQHLARKFDVNEERMEANFPLYRGKLPLDKDGKCYFYEVQFRTHKPIKVKMSTDSLARQIDDFRPYFKSKGEFMRQFSEQRNKEAESIWRNLKYDYASIPMCYAMTFLGNIEGDNDLTEIIQEPTYVGDDFNYILAGFGVYPDSSYPVGAPFYLEGLIKLSSDMKALFVKLAKRQNNPGGIIDTDKIIAEAPDAVSKMREAKRMITEGGWLYARGVQNIEAMFKQFKLELNLPVLLEAIQLCDYEINEFFNTHKEQLGQSPYSGAPAKLVEILQASGGFALGDAIDSMNNLVNKVFRQIAVLAHRYMPPQKRIVLSDVNAQDQLMIVQKEILEKYNPNELDIVVEMDTESERDKQNRAAKAQVAVQFGFMGPKRYLLENGYRDAEAILSELQDYATGQNMVNMMKADPGLAQAVTEYVKVKTLKEEDVNAERT